MNAHETFALPASSRVTLSQNGQLAVYDRRNPVSGNVEIGFRHLRDFSPPDIALALHTHVKEHAIRKPKMLRLRKSIADRVLSIGSYRSGEASQYLHLKDRPLLKIAPPAETRQATDEDASWISPLLGGWHPEDLLEPKSLHLVLLVNGLEAGFGSAAHRKDRGEVLNLALKPEFRKKGNGKSLMNELLGALSAEAHPLLSAFAESKNAPAMEFLAKYGFRPDTDLYFNLYG